MVILRLSVRDVELDLETDARVVCLFGPSGSGKTTCLESIAGLVRPRSGLIRFGERTLFDGGVNLPPRLRRVGYLPQDAPLFPHLNVRRNLCYGARDRDPLPLARSLDIDDLLDRPARRLSGGEQRRVALGRALLVQPEILLLDEPFSGLDANLRGRLVTHVARLDVPHVVLVTHDPRDAIGLADEVIRLDRGREVQRGAPDEVFGPDSDLLEPASLVRGRVVRTDHMYAEVDADGRRLVAHLPGTREGEPVRLQIRADEVTLALTAHEDTSARNQLQVEISRLEQRREQVLVHMDGLLSLLDPRSVEALGLRVGSRVVAQFKASALRRAGL